MPTNRYSYAIDAKPQIDVGSAAVGDATDDYAPPAPQTKPPAPVNLALISGLSQADRSATAYIDAVWDQYGGEVQFYEVEWSLDSFTTVAGGVQAAGTSVRVGALKPGTSYSVRVRAVFREVRSDYGASASITTALDTTPPDPVTGPAAQWSADGELRITWFNPGNANFWRVRLVIRKDNSSGALVLTDYCSTGGYILSREQNRVLAGLYPTLWIELTTQGYAGYLQTIGVVTLTTTKARPANPASVVQSWSGDTGAASADLLITCAALADAVRYRWTLDTVVYETIEPRLLYSLAMNRQQHGGLPDYAIDYSIVGVDGLGQVSATPASGTATNAAPNAPTVTLQSGWQLVLGRITSSPPPDLAAYEWAWERSINSGGAWTSVRTEENSSAAQELENTTDGSVQYRVSVRVKDVFGRYSTVTTSSVVTVDGFSMAAYRAVAKYTDSNSASEATLAVLRDDNHTSNGVAYAQWTSGWRWTQVERSFIDRYMTITVAVTAAVAYVGVSKDGITWTWYSGPYAADGRTLASVASESAAQTAAIALPVDGRLDLPSPIEARFIKLGHRNTTAAYTVYEFYPRTVVEGDDIRGETIKGYMVATRTLQADRIIAGSITASEIAAGAITANQIAANAITAAKILAGAIDGMVITGPTIRSAASGPRWEGNSTRLFGSDGTNDQWEVANADGSFRWGANAGRMSKNGLTMRLSTSVFPTFEPTAAIGWGDTVTSTPRAYVAGFDNSANGTLELRLVMANDATKTATPGVRLIAHNTVTAVQSKLSLFPAELQVDVPDAYFSGNIRATNDIYLGARAVWLSGWLNQSVKSTDDVTFANVTVYGEVTTTGRARFAKEGPSLQLVGSTHTYMEFYPDGVAAGRKAFIGFSSASDNNLTIQSNDQIIFGAANKPTVSGSRGGNAALTGLLTALTNIGLIINSTT